MRFKLIHGLADRAGPFEAEITSARRDRNLSQRICLDARTVQIQLRIGKSVSPTSIFLDNLDSDNVAIKAI